MKTIVNTPDGKKITVNHPDGASKQEIIAYAKKSYKPKREVKPSYGEAALTMVLPQNLSRVWRVLAHL